MTLRSIAAAHATALASLFTSLLMLFASMPPASAQAPPMTWTAIDAPGPAARWDHTLSADSATGTLFLFGGNSNAGPLPDFWVLAERGEGS